MRPCLSVKDLLFKYACMSAHRQVGFLSLLPDNKTRSMELKIKSWISFQNCWPYCSGTSYVLKIVLPFLTSLGYCGVCACVCVCVHVFCFVFQGLKIPVLYVGILNSRSESYLELILLWVETLLFSEESLTDSLFWIYLPSRIGINLACNTLATAFAGVKGHTLELFFILFYMC